MNLPNFVAVIMAAALSMSAMEYHQLTYVILSINLDYEENSFHLNADAHVSDRSQCPEPD